MIDSSFTLDETTDAAIARAAALVADARSVVALTGAGLSVESGIPPFRGPGGLWTRHGEPPMDGYQRFLRNPRGYWEERLAPKEEWARALGDAVRSAKPNPGHEALVELERRGLLAALITQNIDDLHRQAGHRNVLEIHGNHRLLRCSECHERFDPETVAVDPQQLPPICPGCGGMIKGDIVHFGEPIPPDVLRGCFEAIAGADLMIVAGTSATVYPAAEFPYEVLRRGGTVIEVNPEPSELTAVRDDLAARSGRGGADAAARPCRRGPGGAVVKPRNARNGAPCDHEHGGFAVFLRSLLAGIPWSDRAEVLETVHFARPHSGLLHIDNSNGKTRVIGEDRDDIEVRLQKIARAESETAARALAEATRLTANETDAALDLEVAIPRKWNRRGVVNMELRVPRGTRLDVTASNGKVCISSLSASVKARSSNGAVSVENVDGDVEIQSSNAKVHCACVRGRLVARTSNGKIEVTQHSGSIDAATSNGVIDARDSRSERSRGARHQQRPDRPLAARIRRRRRRRARRQRDHPQPALALALHPLDRRPPRRRPRPRRRPDQAAHLERLRLRPLTNARPNRGGRRRASARLLLLPDLAP